MMDKFNLKKTQLISQERFYSILAGFSNLAPVLVIGDVGVDKYTMGSVNRISPEAPVPILEVEREWFKLGLAANVSDNLTALGVSSTLCAVIGEDKHANILESLLEEVGLKTWGLIREEKRHTTYKERVVTSVQQICRVDYESKNPISDVTYDRLKVRFEEFLPAHGSLIIEDYGKGLLTKEALTYIFKRAKELGKFVALDPSRSTPALWYKGCDLLKPNRLEAFELVRSLGHKEKDLEKVAMILAQELELKQLIITLGSEGMLIWEQEQNKINYIPTVAREVFDVSGAGDTAISAALSALMTGATLAEAAWVANCASGVVVGKKGTALVTQEELLAFYDFVKNQFS